MKRAEPAAKTSSRGRDLGVPRARVYYEGRGGLVLDHVERQLESLVGKYEAPDIIIIHCGTNDLVSKPTGDMVRSARAIVNYIRITMPHCVAMWSHILPRLKYDGANDQRAIELKRQLVNRKLSAYVKKPNGIWHRQFTQKSVNLISQDKVHLTSKGEAVLLSNWATALFEVMDL